MLHWIFAAIAALVLLTASLIPDDAYARGRGGGGYRGGGGFHGGGYRGGAVAARGTGAALSQFEEPGVALLQCAADAMVMAATGIGVTVSVRRRSAQRRSALLRQAPTIAAAAATTPTATGFAQATRAAMRRRLGLAARRRKTRLHTFGAVVFSSARRLIARAWESAKVGCGQTRRSPQIRLESGLPATTEIQLKRSSLIYSTTRSNSCAVTSPRD